MITPTGATGQFRQVRSVNQPYAIPPSGVYRQYSMNNRTAQIPQQRYVQRAVPRVTYSTNTLANGNNEMVMPQNEQMQYEEVVYDDNY